MIAVFVNPGHLEGGKSPYDKSWETTNRASEYITNSGHFAQLLIGELIPEVSKKYKITSNAEGHCIVGRQSGWGGRAFIAAWERPDYFGKVITHLGSFVNGPNIYPGMVLAEEMAKPIRISMQENAGDNRNEKSHSD